MVWGQSVVNTSSSQSHKVKQLLQLCFLVQSKKSNEALLSEIQARKRFYSHLQKCLPAAWCLNVVDNSSRLPMKPKGCHISVVNAVPLPYCINVEKKIWPTVQLHIIEMIL